MDLNTVGRTVIYLGIALVVLGGVLMLFSRIPFLKNLGHLPGDIRVQGAQFFVLLPGRQHDHPQHFALARAEHYSASAQPLTHATLRL